MTTLALIVLSFAGFLAGGLAVLVVAVRIADLLSDLLFEPHQKTDRDH